MKLLQSKPTLRRFVIFAGVLIAAGLMLTAILAAYSVPWTGFADYEPSNSALVRGKTLWDWMELLIIPMALAMGAFYLERSESAVERNAAVDRAMLERKAAKHHAKLERKLATDHHQEAALQAYLDRMAELLLKEKLLEGENQKVLDVARARTLSVLRGLNAARNGIVLRFLRDIGVAGNPESNLFVNANLEGVDLAKVDLSSTNLHRANLKDANLKRAVLLHANLQEARLESAQLDRAILTNAHMENALLKGARLPGAHLESAHMKHAQLMDANLEAALLMESNLQEARLEGAQLQRAFLTGADLTNANLGNANLEDANLKNAKLGNANLRNANLKGAIVSNDQLAIAKSLKGAIMPDGTTHD